MRQSALLLVVLLLLAACGQKGPLHLPDETASGTSSGSAERDAAAATPH